ncbi:MAG: hypothetical protein EZS28_016210 [Streblomastix strix]|uniref:Uncharacterized protein n=1 Tax=Streblomastix strix TaxID=222440 RepID=A0A5J4W003_9EUKA|nr:MAG: hypothetical protein EZS28_016210 [Streblomastix strix]
MVQFYIHLTYQNQDIGQLQADVQDINTELARQTHFRGYFTTNDEILALTDVSNGDYAYSVEDLLVWIYDTSCNCRCQTEHSRGDHVLPLNITSTILISDSTSGSVGSTNYYARIDLSHPLNITTSVPPQDSTSGSVGTTNYYARNDHSHPINVWTNASNIPMVNALPTGYSKMYQLFQNTRNGSIQINPIGDTQGIIGNNGPKQLGFAIAKAGQEGQTDRGLQISADGNTLTFNGQVIAGTGFNKRTASKDISLQLTKLLRELKIVGATAYSIRYSATTELIKLDFPEENLATFIRHSQNSRTVQQYYIFESSIRAIDIARQLTNNPGQDNERSNQISQQQDEIRRERGNQLLFSSPFEKVQ